jgi:hypothetical protein
MYRGRLRHLFTRERVESCHVSRAVEWGTRPLLSAPASCLAAGACGFYLALAARRELSYGRTVFPNWVSPRAATKHNEIQQRM